jgi:ribosomal protein S19
MVDSFSEIDSQVNISCKKFETASIKLCFVGIKLGMSAKTRTFQSRHFW